MNGKTTLGQLISEMNAGQVTRDDVIASMRELTVIHWGAEVDRPGAGSAGQAADKTSAEQKEISTMNQPTDDYTMAMGRPADSTAERQIALGDHAEELHGPLAKVRDAHARAEISRAAAERREREADFEMGA